LKKKLLIVEAGFRTHKEFILQCLIKTGKCDLYFANGLSSRLNYSWLEKYSSGGFNFKYHSDDLALKIADFQIQNKMKFDGIITWIDTSVHFVNEAQHKLGLPVISEYRDKSIRNKGLSRERLKESGVDDTFFKVIKSPQEIAGLKSEIKFPVVLKPTEMMASLGAKLIHSFEELKEKLPGVLKIDFLEEDLRDLYGDIASEAILEEFLKGPGYSIESIVQDGETQIIGIHAKFTETMFDTGNILSPELEQDVRARIDKLARDCHKALRIKNSITHIEIRVVNGIPKVIEINNRLGGDYIPFMIHNNKGRDIGKILLAAATGERKISVKNEPASRFASYYTTNQPGRILTSPKPRFKKLLEEKSYYSNLDLVYHNDENDLIYLGHVVTGIKHPRKSFFNQHKIQKPLHVEKNKLGREIMVFLATKEDTANLVNIEHSTWSASQAASEKTINTRLKANPERFIIAYDKKTRSPMGFIYWVPATESEIKGTMDWSYFDSPSIISRKDRLYKYRYIVSISVKPEAPRSTGSILLKSLKKYCQQNKITEFTYGLRLAGYHRFAEEGLSIDSYVNGLKNRKYLDPAFEMAINAEGSIVNTIENYYDDPESLNYGLLVSHKIGDVK
jgi:hypothetical protein